MKTHKGISLIVGLMCLAAALVVAGCMQRSTPTTPTSLTSLAPADPPAQLGHDMADMAAHRAVAGDKGYIDGWFNGETVQLYYTKAFFCEEPPDSGADSHCEVGAAAEEAPRPGPIPTIYAIAAAGGIQPDPSTVACLAGSPCLDHPSMIDLSRVRPGAFNAPAVSHSHILAEHHAGWFNTVNIRVFNLGVWNQIAAAKTLEKVRELQADPNVGGKGLISQDTPTNIYFFIASWR
jgi:hypothetical protein